MLWEQYREDLVFGILCGVYFALVGGHEAPSPDNQFPIFRLALAKLYEFLDGHIVAVACGVPARQFPAELEAHASCGVRPSMPISLKSSGDDHLRYGRSSYWRATLRHSSGP